MKTASTGIRYLLVFLCLPLSYAANAQDSVAINIKWGTGDKQLNDILRFQGIEQNEIDIVDKQLKGKTVVVSFEEFTEGKVTNHGVLTKGLPDQLFQATGDTFHLKLINQPVSDSVGISFNYPRFTSKTYYKTVEAAEHYSMRNVAVSDGSKFLKLPANKEKQAIFSYSLPYETPDKPGQRFYCQLTASGVAPAKWWDVYHVKHYIIFYLQIG